MQNPPSQELVRRFSDRMQDIDPADSLHRGLGAKVAHDRAAESRDMSRSQWNALFNDVNENIDSFVTDEEEILIVQSRKLFAAWDKFQKALPKDQRKDATSKPDLKVLFGAVQTSSKTWQQQKKNTKRGKVKSAFGGLCQHLQDHQSILNLIPNQSEYFSLLCGSLTTVILAGVNHKAIAEAVESTLEELGQKIGFWNRQVELHGEIKHMYRYIVELYVVVFEFLTQVFELWSKSSFKRFVTSFNENVLKDLFTEKRARMASIEVYMEREARLECDRRTKQQLDELRAAKEELLQSTRLILQNQVSSTLSMQELRVSLGTSIQKLLEEREPAPTLALTSTRSGWVAEESDGDWVEVQSEEKPAADVDPPPATDALAYDEVAEKIDHLQVLTEKDLEYIMELIARMNKFDIDTKVERRLNQWMRTTKRDVFWAQGPHGVPKPSQNTGTAIFVTALARRSNLKCIAHFCHLDDQPPPKQQREACLMAMLTSLITQLILLTPLSQITDLTATHPHLDTLVSESLSFDQALDMLSALRPVGPPLLMVVIDNIQVLEDRSDQEHTIRLLRTIGILCNLDTNLTDADTNDGDHERYSSETKICFTSDGYVDALAQAVSLGLLDKVEFAVEAEDGDADESNALTL